MNPDQHEVSYFLGVTLRRLDRDRRGDRARSSAMPDTHERFPEARTQIAGIYEKQGDYARAIAEVERARARGEARPLDLYVASLRSRAGDFDGALEFLQGLLEAGARRRGAALQHRRDPRRGEAQRARRSRWMEKALEKQPDHAGALNYIGYSWAEQGDEPRPGRGVHHRALELKPEDGYITDSLALGLLHARARRSPSSGRAARRARLFERAIRELEQANELTGGDPVISEHMGDVYLLARAEGARARDVPGGAEARPARARAAAAPREARPAAPRARTAVSRRARAARFLAAAAPRPRAPARLPDAGARARRAAAARPRRPAAARAAGGARGDAAPRARAPRAARASRSRASAARRSRASSLLLERPARLRLEVLGRARPARRGARDRRRALRPLSRRAARRSSPARSTRASSTRWRASR